MRAARLRGGRPPLPGRARARRPRRCPRGAVPGAGRARAGRLPRRRPARLRGAAVAAAASAAAPPGARSCWPRPRSSSRRCPTRPSNAVAEQLCEEALAGLGTAGGGPARPAARATQPPRVLRRRAGARRRPERGGARPGPRLRGRPRAGGGAARPAGGLPGTGRPGRAAAELATEMIALARRTGVPAPPCGASCGGSTRWSRADGSRAPPRSSRACGSPSTGSGARSARGISTGSPRASPRRRDATSRPRRPPPRGGSTRMRPVEPAPASGAYFALQFALARHVGVRPEAQRFLDQDFDPPPRFRTQLRIARASLLLAAGRPDEAAASYRRAGPLATWSLPVFFVVSVQASAAALCGELGRDDDLAVLLEGLETVAWRFRRGHRGVLPRSRRADPRPRCPGPRTVRRRGRRPRRPRWRRPTAPGRPGSSPRRSTTSRSRCTGAARPGDHDRAAVAARDADRLARALGMAAWVDRTTALAARLRPARRHDLSPREAEVAALVAEGLTNRQIASRLVISERTARTTCSTSSPSSVSPPAAVWPPASCVTGLRSGLRGSPDVRCARRP